MKFQDSTIDSLEAYVSRLSFHQGELNKKNLWFRGHSDQEWKLQPSLIRRYAEKAPEKGWYFFKRFIQESYPFLERTPSSSWDWVFLMQHYGLPTNLLDWSESPLIALYFAVEEGNDDKDGVIWGFDPEQFNRSMGHPVETGNQLPMFNFETSLEKYLPEQAKSSDAELPIAAIPTKNSSRIAAQHGVFTAHSLNDNVPIEEIKIQNTDGQNVDPDYIWKYRIPRDRKSAMRSSLSALRIDAFQIFPELSNLKDRILKET